MTIEQFHKRMSRGSLYIPPHCEENSAISMTDPTQDCPVKTVYDALVNGKPITARESQNIYNSLSVNQLSAIERRHTDQFDVHIEAKSIGKKFSKNAKIVEESDKDKDK